MRGVKRRAWLWGNQAASRGERKEQSEWREWRVEQQRAGGGESRANGDVPRTFF